MIESLSANRPLRRAIVLFIVGFAVVTALVLSLLLVHLRSGAVQTGEKLAGAFAQLIDEQSSRTVQNIGQTLEIVESRLNQQSPEDDTAAVNALLAQQVRERPFLRAIWVVGPDGKTTYASDPPNMGVDRADRPYILYARDEQGPPFHLQVPFRDRATGDWFIPATRRWESIDGRSAGVIVAAVNPYYFDRAWNFGDKSADYLIGLFRTDGFLLMRSPFEARALAVPFGEGPVFAKIAAGQHGGSFEGRSSVDGERRLVAFRQLDDYPDLFVLVGVSVDHVLADWRNILWAVLIGWAVTVGAMSMLSMRVAREWKWRRASQRIYQTLFDANPFPMAVVERGSLNYLAVNDAAIRQYGWSRQDFQSMSAWQVMAPEEQATLQHTLEALESSTGEWHRGHRHIRKDGSAMDVELALRPIIFHDKHAILAISHDVTERLRAEGARTVAEEKLHHAQKLEAVGQLTGGVAHDFNNILNIILLNTDALTEENDLPPVVIRRVEKIARAVQRASDLTRQLLAFSRKQPLWPEATDMNDLVASTGRMLGRVLGENMEIVCQLSANLWSVKVDRAQLEAALIDLCLNARDAMPAGGALRIETKNVTLAEADLPHDADIEPGAYALLSVTDSGTGIAPDLRDKIFEPFFTTKPQGKGTGLGLSMVYGFIKQSHGHVTVESELGHGTTFKLYLPRNEDVPVEETEPTAPEPAVRGTARLLLAEDDPDLRESIARKLRKLGYDVVEAGDGTAALQAFAETAAPFDLLLTDVVMPGPLNGKALADEVARRYPRTRIIFMSGYAENALMRDGIADPGVRMLSKPFRTADLSRFVSDALDPGEGVGTGSRERPLEAARSVFEAR